MLNFVPMIINGRDPDDWRWVRDLLAISSKKKHSDSPKRTNKHVSTFQPEFKITNLKVGELFSWMKVALATICPQHIGILQEAGVVMIDMIGKLRDG